ncbi:hypothetical protein J2741_001822 [Methanolinea mesophila]|uniref:hypothetical protein n=1 Tax=Methanolinea mesophila TaxID=547055 RepID=UPI001AE1EC79|nr:hypothetical protein [Methanolinea mesophila]MBP1929275.1 hypothetical protein [Methanolinea mesophila]
MRNAGRAGRKTNPAGDRYTVSLDLRETPWWPQLCTTAREVGIRFGLGSKVVGTPHITLYGPFTLRAGVSPGRVRAGIAAAAKGHDSLEFAISGWKRLKSRGLSEVIAHDVIASPGFADFYCAIVRELSGLTVTHKWQDRHPDPGYLHISVILGLYYQARVEDIWQALIGDAGIAPLVLTANASNVSLKGTFRTWIFDLSRQRWLHRYSGETLSVTPGKCEEKCGGTNSGTREAGQ